MLVLACTCIVAVVACAFLNFLDNNGAFDSTLDDCDTGVFVIVVALEVFKACDAADVGYASTGNNSFGDGCTGCAQCIIDTVLLLLHLNFGGGTFGKALVELLLVVVACSGFNLSLYLSYTLSNGFLGT